MVLKFKNSDGNWEFKDGEICYRYIPFSDVLDSYLDDNGQIGRASCRERV